MTERSWVQTLTEETIFYAPFNWIKSLEQVEIPVMQCSNLPGIVAWVGFVDSFITKDEHEVCLLTKSYNYL
jgi:hypothetical protein